MLFVVVNVRVHHLKLPPHPGHARPGGSSERAAPLPGPDAEVERPEVDQGAAVAGRRAGPPVWSRMCPQLAGAAPVGIRGLMFPKMF